MRRSWILFIAATALIGCGGEKVLLRLNLKEGQQFKLRYLFESTKSSSGVIEFTTLWKVIKAQNKEYTLRMSVEDIQIAGVPPHALEPIKKMTFTSVIDEYGKSKSKRVENAPPGFSDSQPFQEEDIFTLYPKHEVSPGDSWSEEVSIQGEKLKIEVHFEGVKKIEGKDTYYFVLELAEEHPDIKFTEPVRLWIDRKDGFVERMHCRIEDTSKGEGVKITAERL
ncbi:MAG TPA: hypothetical protein VNK96_01890 [Fimbriimonadales bacterium]|nr:hypothetical protein [Fimbriimonadales bacterium]